MPLLAVGLGLLVGILPALAASRRVLVADLKESAGGITGERNRQQSGRALVVAEIAFALALLITVSGRGRGAARPSPGWL